MDVLYVPTFRRGHHFYYPRNLGVFQRILGQALRTSIGLNGIHAGTVVRTVCLRAGGEAQGKISNAGASRVYDEDTVRIKRVPFPVKIWGKPQT